MATQTKRDRREQARLKREELRRREARRRRLRVAAGAVAAAAAAAAVVAVLTASKGGGGSPTAPFVGGDLHSLVVDPSDPTRLFVGGHEGVAVSTNAGETWRSVDALGGADAMGWAFTDDAVMVGGHPGLEVSTDGGMTFEQQNEGLPNTDVHALGAGGRVIYGASPAAGVFASTDGGETWQMRTEQAGQSFMGRILVDPEDSDHLVAPDMQAGAVQSNDGGLTWRSLGGVPGAMWVSWDPDDPLHIISSAQGTAAETTDGGRTWTPIEVPSGVLIVEMAPGEPDTLFGAAHEGSNAVVYVSHDGGRRWTRS